MSTQPNHPTTTISLILNNINSTRQKPDPNKDKQTKSEFRRILSDILTLSTFDNERISFFTPILKVLLIEHNEEASKLIIESINSMKSEIKVLVKEEGQIKERFFLKIINFSYLIYCLTIDLHKKNQVLSNFLELINEVLSCLLVSLSSLSKDKYLVVYYYTLLRIYLGIIENIKSYSSLFVKFLYELVFFLVNKENFQGNEDKDLPFKQVLQLTCQETMSFSYSHFFSLVLSLISTAMCTFLSNDINFDIIFKEIISLLSNFPLQEPNLQQEIIRIISTYTKTKSKSVIFKSIPMRFLVLKQKEVSQLSPDYEDYEKRTYEDINKSMKRKLNKNRRQIVRNIKKQSIIITQERKKKEEYVSYLKEEDRKFRNQFLENAILEGKRISTTQNKSRHKIRNRK